MCKLLGKPSRGPPLCLPSAFYVRISSFPPADLSVRRGRGRRRSLRPCVDMQRKLRPYHRVPPCMWIYNRKHFVNTRDDARRRSVVTVLHDLCPMRVPVFRRSWVKHVIASSRALLLTITYVQPFSPFRSKAGSLKRVIADCRACHIELQRVRRASPRSFCIIVINSVSLIAPVDRDLIPSFVCTYCVTRQ